MSISSNAPGDLHHASLKFKGLPYFVIVSLQSLFVHLELSCNGSQTPDDISILGTAD